MSQLAIDWSQYSGALGRLIAGAFVVTIGIVLTTLVRRLRRRRLERGVSIAPRPDGSLFTVKYGKWQSRALTVVAVSVGLIGAFMAVMGFATREGDSGVEMAWVGLSMVALSVVLVDMAARVKRFQVDGYADCLVVQPMYGSPRQLTPGQFTAFKAEGSRVGGIRVLAGRKAVLTMTRLAQGYENALIWLQAVRPDLEVPAGSEPLI
ncbi:MAG: hypothetical protein LBJ62_02865 [Bifidobacteriaceae bacterium]|jgi:hypothetical protein|nr:hypothetical protein [Bifidobacteriaceae bacterium]